MKVGSCVVILNGPRKGEVTHIRRTDLGYGGCVEVDDDLGAPYGGWFIGADDIRPANLWDRFRHAANKRRNDSYYMPWGQNEKT